jgi:hypothetical protein
MTSLFGVPVDAAYHLETALTAVLTPLLGGLAAVLTGRADPRDAAQLIGDNVAAYE